MAIVDALAHSWLTGLGEYGKDNYGADNAMTMWIVFVLATIVVQLVFMNLLIAIMSEQYSRLNDAKEQNKLKEVCKMMYDHIWLLKPHELYREDRYILVLGPDRRWDYESADEKKIGEMQEYFEDRVNKSDSDMMKRLSGVEEQLISL